MKGLETNRSSFACDPEADGKSWEGLEKGGMKTEGKKGYRGAEDGANWSRRGPGLRKARGEPQTKVRSWGRWSLGDCDDKAKAGRLSGSSRAPVLVPLLAYLYSVSTHA